MDELWDETHIAIRSQMSAMIQTRSAATVFPNRKLLRAIAKPLASAIADWIGKKGRTNGASVFKVSGDIKGERAGFNE